MHLKLEDLTEAYAFCDPAGGKQVVKRIRSRAAVCVVAMDSLERYFTLYAWAARATTNQLYDKLFWVNDKFRPRLFGVEANGLQSLFGDGVLREARLTDVKIPVTPVIQPPKLDKFFRNRTALQPIIADGRLFLQEHQVELRSELETHPMGGTYDLTDALVGAISLIPKRAPQQKHDERLNALAKYLRDSGAPPWYIEKRVNELKGRENEEKAC